MKPNQTRYHDVNKRRQNELKDKKTPVKKCLVLLDKAVIELSSMRDMFAKSNPIRNQFTEVTYKIRECEEVIMDDFRSGERKAIKYKEAQQQADYINAYRRNMAFAFAFADMLDHPDINGSGLVGAINKHGRGMGKTRMRTAIPMLLTLIYLELSVIGSAGRMAKFMGYKPELMNFVFRSLSRRKFIVKPKLSNGKQSYMYILTDKGKLVAVAAKNILDDHLKNVSRGLNKLIEQYNGGKISDENGGGELNIKLRAQQEIFQEYNKAAAYANSIENERAK